MQLNDNTYLHLIIGSALLIGFFHYGNLYMTGKCEKNENCNCFEESLEYVADCSNNVSYKINKNVSYPLYNIARYSLELNCKGTHLSPKQDGVIPFSVKNDFQLKLVDCVLPENVSIAEILSGVSNDTPYKIDIKCEDIANFSLERYHLTDLRKLQFLFIDCALVNDFLSDLLYDNPLLQVFSLTNSQITNLSSEFFSAGNYFQYITITHSKLKSVPWNIFHNLVYLWSVKLSFNMLEYLHPLTFFGLTRLTYVDLRGNRLSFVDSSANKLHEFTFLPLPRLTFLKLDGNMISDLQLDYFTNLTLSTFEVSSTNLTKFSRNFEIFSGIEKLDISWNNIECLGSSTSGECTNNNISVQDVDTNVSFTLNNLENFYSSHSNIKQIQPDFFRNATKLKILDLSHNNISELPKDIFQGLISLENLLLNNNMLGNLHEELFQSLDQLKNLTIHNNNLTVVNAEHFQKLSKLQILDLSHNRLSNLNNDTFKVLLRLRSLILSHNMLSKVPSMPYAAPLAELTLSNNLLKEFSFSIVQDIIELKYLDLSFNQLHEVSILDITMSLIELNLSNNNLTHFCFLRYPKFPLMKTLDLSHNFISISDRVDPVHVCFTSWLLRNYRVLEVLRLSHNRIKSMLSDWRKDLRYLQILDLSYNDIDGLTSDDLLYSTPITVTNVTHNQLTFFEVDEKELEPSPKCYFWNASVSITNNPISCECGVFRMLRLANRDVILKNKDFSTAGLELGDLSCQSPSLVRGKALSDVEGWSLDLLALLGLCSLFS